VACSDVPNETLLTPPTPRIDLSSGFSSNTFSDGSVQYSYLDPDNGHGLTMFVDPQGTLGFDIRAGGDTATLGTGTDMFTTGMQALSNDGVQVNAIRGYWMEGSDSVNYQAYQQNLLTMPAPDAAANTWTGQMAGRYGFTNVGQPTASFGNTTVIFTRPAQ
jgi:hypothetical protein